MGKMTVVVDCVREGWEESICWRDHQRLSLGKVP